MSDTSEKDNKEHVSNEASSEVEKEAEHSIEPTESGPNQHDDAKGFVLELNATDFQRMKRHPRYPKHFGDKSNELKPRTTKKKKPTSSSSSSQTGKPTPSSEKMPASDSESDFDDNGAEFQKQEDQFLSAENLPPYPFLPIAMGGVRVLDGIFDPKSLIPYGPGFVIPSPKAFNPALDMPGYPPVEGKESTSTIMSSTEQPDTISAPFSEKDPEKMDKEELISENIMLKKQLLELNQKLAAIEAKVPHPLPFSDRKFLSLQKWHCIPRPQYKASCGVCTLTATFNFLYSVLGTGTLPPLSTEQVISILGIPPPFDTINYGRFTGNATIMTWFHILLRHFNLKGRCVYLWKASGGNKTAGVTRDSALKTLKDAIRSDKSMIIYHCHNHYICAVGYEDTPPHSTLAYSQRPVDSFTMADLPSPAIAGSIYTKQEKDANPQEAQAQTVVEEKQPEPASGVEAQDHPATTTSSSSTSSTAQTPETEALATSSPSPASSSVSSTAPPEPLPIRTTIILADTSRTNSTLLSAKWDDIATDIESLPPNHFNIRRPWLGVYERPTKKKVKGNIHCLMKFSKG